MSTEERPSSNEIYSNATDASVSLDHITNSFPEEFDVANSSPEAEDCASVSNDESSFAAVSDFGDSNHSGDIAESNLKIESVELSNVADTESSSSSVSDLDDTSSCSEREADNVLVAEDPSLLSYDHYTSQYLNHTKNVVESVATESLSGEDNTLANAENFQNQQIDHMAEKRSDDSLVAPDDKDWMLGLPSSTSSIEEKTTRFIRNGYLDTVDDGMFDLLSLIYFKRIVLKAYKYIYVVMYLHY